MMAHNIKHLCTACNLEIRANNFKKHVAICKGVKVKKVRGIDFDPNAGYKDGSRQGWNKGLTAETDLRVHQNSIAIKASGKTIGKCKDPLKEIERKKKISVKNKANGSGGYKSNAGRSKKFKVYDSFGNQTTLQSTYEYAVFEILCELEIRWIRPKALKYDGKNYFGDFHLIDSDIYLDPKNCYKARLDTTKIFKVIEQNNVKLYILHRHQITKQYIARLAEMD